MCEYISLKNGESHSYWNNKNNQKSKLVSFLWFIALVICFIGASWMTVCPFLDKVR